MAHLSRDIYKRVLRENAYWPLLAKHNPLPDTGWLLTLPGSLAVDAEIAQKTLRIPRERMMCVDDSTGVVASFNRRFPGTTAICEDVFTVIRGLSEGGWEKAFGLIDLDLCGAATPKVLDELRFLRHSNILAPKAVIGVTSCKRMIQGRDSGKKIKEALSPCVLLWEFDYYNHSKHSPMLVTVVKLTK